MLQVVLAHPLDACSPLTQTFRPQDRAVVLVRKASDACLARVSALNVVKSGAAGGEAASS